jgi:kynureninase
VIYLDGNSLGALPRSTAARVSRVIEREWGEDLITSWNRHDWIGMPQRVGDKIARLIGADAGEVVVSESTSLNLFKVLAAALKMRPGRRVILSERENFPTDLYIAEGLVDLLDQDYALRLVVADDLEQALGADTAVLMLTQVNFRTGAIRHGGLTAAAHAAGALAIWDAVPFGGALPVDLNGARADFAIGCGYKEVPQWRAGAPAFVYAAARHHGQRRSALWLARSCRAIRVCCELPSAAGIRQYTVSTQPILALAALEEGVDLLLQADLAQLWVKSQALTEAFITLVDARCAGLGLSLATPRDPARRGSQVSFAHEQSYAVMQALIARGVVGDFRAPDLIRFGFTPLYIRHVDVWDAAEALRDSCNRCLGGPVPVRAVVT